MTSLDYQFKLGTAPTMQLKYKDKSMALEKNHASNQKWKIIYYLNIWHISYNFCPKLLYLVGKIEGNIVFFEDDFNMVLLKLVKSQETLF